MKPQRYLNLGLLLTGCAGCIDAVGFIELGGFYTSFMSGNTTQLGTGQSQATALLLPFGLIVMFFLGSVAGSLAALRNSRWGPSYVLVLVMLSVTTTLVLLLLGVPASYAMLILAAGAGAQNATLPFTGGARLGATFVTGTLFAAGQDLAGAIQGTAPRWRWLQHLQVWGALLLGAFIGATLYSSIGVLALVLPALIYLGLFVAFAVRSPIA